MNQSPAISALCTPAKLDVGATTPSLRRRTDDTDIKQLIHRNLSNAVLGGDNQEDIKTKDISWEKLEWLREWKNRYMRKSHVYPVLFKKICFYSIVNSRMSGKAFLSKINMRENILEK